MKAHIKLANIDRMLKGTNWAAAPACAILAGEVDLLIARLYNKAEKAMTRSSESPQAPAAAADAPEIAAPSSPDQGDKEEG